MPTTTELTEQYVRERPSTRDCLKRGIVNYSKLSRKIAADLGIGKKSSMEAILIACRRLEAKLRREQSQEDAIRAVLKKSELHISNKVLVAIVQKQTYAGNVLKIEKKIRSNADTFHSIEGSKVFTIITAEKYEQEIRGIFRSNVVKIVKRLALITIRSPEQMETTPGVVAYLFSLLADRGINVRETMSCWTDTLFLIAEDDVASVMQILRL